MLLNIVGYFYCFLGLIYLVKPGWMKARLKRKSIWKLRKIFFLLALSVSGLLIQGAWALTGMIPKVLVFLGILGVIKSFFFLTSKASEKVIDYSLVLPDKYFRCLSLLCFAFGVFLIHFQ